MTAEVVKPRFLIDIAGNAARRCEGETEKASLKWLAFNDFYRGELTVFGIARPLSRDIACTQVFTFAGLAHLIRSHLSGVTAICDKPHFVF